MPQLGVKKLALIFAIFSFMIQASIEAVLTVVSHSRSPDLNINISVLEYISCIHYPIQFRKNQANVQILIDSESEVNTITSIYTFKLGLKV